MINNILVKILDVMRIMSQSRDYDELLHYWQAWHEAVGPPLKIKYVRYVQLANQAAKLNGTNDLTAFTNQ